MMITFDLQEALTTAGRLSDDACWLSYEIVDHLRANTLDDDQRAAVIQDILTVFQDFPDTDWGCPGPLVRWLEEPANTELSEALVQAAMLTRPAPHLVLMVRRQLNGARTTTAKQNALEVLLRAMHVEGISPSMQELLRDMTP